MEDLSWMPSSAVYQQLLFLLKIKSPFGEQSNHRKASNYHLRLNELERVHGSPRRETARVRLAQRQATLAVVLDNFDCLLSRVYSVQQVTINIKLVPFPTHEPGIEI